MPVAPLLFSLLVWIVPFTRRRHCLDSFGAQACTVVCHASRPFRLEVRLCHLLHVAVAGSLPWCKMSMRSLASWIPMETVARYPSLTARTPTVWISYRVAVE